MVSAFNEASYFFDLTVVSTFPGAASLMYTETLSIKEPEETHRHV